MLRVASGKSLCEAVREVGFNSKQAPRNCTYLINLSEPIPALVERLAAVLDVSPVWLVGCENKQ